MHVSTEEPISLLFTIDFLIEEVYLEALVGCKVIDWRQFYISIRCKELIKDG